jgi:fructose-1,6-bisphosphatase
MTQLTDTLRKVVNANAFEEGEAKMGYVEDWFFKSAKLDTTKLVKGKGVFVNVNSPNTKSKLRTLYEVAPIGYLIEKAGRTPKN